MDKLKRCPFCGGEAFLQKHRVMGDERFTETWIQCLECFATTRNYLSAKRAIEAWNRRVENDG